MRFSLILICLLLAASFLIIRIDPKLSKYQTDQLFPAPTEGEENAKLRSLYEALRHRAAPGVIWEQIEAENLKRDMERLHGAQSVNFANGAINGMWLEKGATNQAGSIRAVDYVPSTNTVYTISTGGSLWSSILNSGVWTIRNQNVQFDPKIIRAFNKTSGGVRLLLSLNKNIYYSDDNGATLIPSTGITFPFNWVGDYVSQLVVLNDGSNTVYCLTRPWSVNPWGAFYWLYRSTNQGASFTKIHEFNSGDDDDLSLCIPYNSTNLFAAELQPSSSNIVLHGINGTSVSALNTFNIGGSNTKVLLKGTHLGGVTTLYALINNNSLWRSTNLGSSWTSQGPLPEEAWNKMNVSPSNAANVSYGSVNAFRSNNSGANWTMVNSWGEYYNNISSKLHADIMEIEYFKKSDNTEFAIINTHGGTYVSYDNLVTVSNQSMSGHRTQEYYDVLTDTVNTNRIFAGSQDQGLQGTLTGSNMGSQNFSQIISGDYGHLSLTALNQFLWGEYPGGAMYTFTNLQNASPTYTGVWQLQGTQKSNYGFLLPSKPTVIAADNAIWIGGGNITGGGGSYLAKVTMLTTFPYTKSATQFPYDFRPNSNSGTAGITAIEQSTLDPARLYVAMEDGTFFYSTTAGASWNKTSSFTGPTPFWLYGSSILASRLNQNIVWFGGSGYSNPPVYKSIDGGITFAPMSTGLPATLVNEIAASPDEQFLFAATDAGPYVYVTAENKWYSLASPEIPFQRYSSVQYVRSGDVVRFGTMGRGIWDFHIVNCTNGLIAWTGGGGNTAWENPLNWSCGAVPVSTSKISIPAGAVVVLNSNVTIASMNLSPTANFTVGSGFRLTVTGQ